MASTQNVVLLNESIISSTTTLGDSLSLSNYNVDLIAACTISNRVDGTYTLTVEHSPDGVNWLTLDSCAAISANGIVIKEISASSLYYVRASLLSGSVTTGADVECKLWFSNRK